MTTQHNSHSKTCFKCGEEKPFDEFYKHPAMADGRLGKCKECTKSDVNKNREAKKGYYLAYDRLRYRADDARNENCKRHGRKKKSLTPEQREKHREKIRARRIAYRAMRRGELVRPAICPKCFSHEDDCGTIQMHHKDYARPMEIEWLCPSCHGLLHSKPIMAGLPF